MAVAEFQGVYWDQKGLDSFSKACALPNITVEKQIGPDRPKHCLIPLLGLQFCMEAMLDIEYIKGVGGSVPLTDVFQSAYSLEQLAQTLLAHLMHLCLNSDRLRRLHLRRGQQILECRARRVQHQARRRRRLGLGIATHTKERGGAA